MPRKSNPDPDGTASRLASVPPPNIIRRPIELPPMRPVSACRCDVAREEECPTHGVDASLKREDAYWQSVGGR